MGFLGLCWIRKWPDPKNGGCKFFQRLLGYFGPEVEKKVVTMTWPREPFLIFSKITLFYPIRGPPIPQGGQS